MFSPIGSSISPNIPAIARKLRQCPESRSAPVRRSTIGNFSRGRGPGGLQRTHSGADARSREVDIVLASELMEAGRAIQRGLVTPDRTTLIASTHRVYSMTEKTALTDGRVDSAQLIEAEQRRRKDLRPSRLRPGRGRHAQRDQRCSFRRARRNRRIAIRSPLNSRTRFERWRRRRMSLAGFSAAFDSARQPSVAKPRQPPRKSRARQRRKQRSGRSFNRLPPDRIAIPPATHAILFAGIERLADYQDVAYASTYLDDSRRSETGHQSAATKTSPSSPKLARHFALWMSYEDAIRVCRPENARHPFRPRPPRSRANKSELIQIKEFLHPRLRGNHRHCSRPLGRWLRNPMAADSSKS